ncbi:hypothetical protein J1N35_019328 [Gossypium stocksii]|uniref:RNase H type-1 domain-containing protein n=1 Tax=Gossypium stocksii TaxID=47602 RepID=A0A9D3VQP3_9ROSI|nr:hypothetical protein J1N35_019328 [Gossypium stocksii]
MSCETMIFLRVKRSPAEARAILEGMLLARDRGFGAIQVESDNAVLIDLILATKTGSNMIIRCVKFKFFAIR